MPQVTDAYGNTFNVDRRDVGDVERQAQYEKSLIDGTVFEKYNIERQILCLVRDRMGIKPLFYYCNNNSLAFGSEIKSFKPSIRPICSA